MGDAVFEWEQFVAHSAKPIAPFAFAVLGGVKLGAGKMKLARDVLRSVIPGLRHAKAEAVGADDRTVFLLAANLADVFFAAGDNARRQAKETREKRSASVNSCRHFRGSGDVVKMSRKEAIFASVIVNGAAWDWR